MEYGDWASDVITGLGFRKISCLSGALGVPILLKLMCVAPEKVEKAVLVVPAGFVDGVVPSGIMASVGNFLMRHVFAKNDERLKKVLLPMAVKEEHISDATLEMFKHSYKHVVVNNYRPAVVNPEDRHKIGAEDDCTIGGIMAFGGLKYEMGKPMERFEAYAIAIQNGFLTVNEVRQLEGLPLLSGNNTNTNGRVGE